MKCLFPFKDKASKSAPAAAERRKSNDPRAQRVTKSASSITNASSSRRSIPALYEEKAHNLRVFSFSELTNATNDFHRSLKIGEGGFGSVYKGFVKPPDGDGERIAVAIKKLNKESLQGHKQWVAEVQFLAVVEHPNLVKLIGYCAADGERGIQRLLVYEFMPNKTLEDHLFSPALPVLPWKRRLEIVLGAAQGLAYLHGGLEVQVVGTYGYAAPDYVETGHLTIKSDVWSFGVVLYEILTGRRSLERNRPRMEQKLLEWVKEFPVDNNKFVMIMDPRLRNHYSLGAARMIAKLADRCLSKQSKDRPMMAEVVATLKQAIQASKTIGPPETDAAPSSMARLGNDKRGDRANQPEQSRRPIAARERRW
ncbi:probable serine/threonine-protein kinase PBL19 isoform X3 [Magnolia sinica]|uniref:probable serine/threonine-protein kinase PBL19 isoform X3 n=1 Tax=Magnolia sinica TaxID=86752 RepID=UPI002658F553|nr:probable serine/threonine-protein kinase PBL19 isoform X3 [Magnolia sinica]